jgi:LDH2 family malate/lactate/ureidoglycolate dehydrogenase
MVELLAGPLVGAATADKLASKNWGNLVIALDPELLGDREEIRARVQVRTARPDRPRSGVWTAGSDCLRLGGRTAGWTGAAHGLDCCKECPPNGPPI